MSEPVICPAILFSDHVIVERGTNKLSLIGCFSRFNAVDFPWRTVPFVATVLLTNMGRDLDECDLTLRIEEPQSAHVLTNVSCHLAREVAGPHPEDDIAELPMPVQPFVIPAPGKYRATALLNGEPLASRHLVVMQVTEDQGARRN